MIRVEFAEWTADGLLRQAAFKGIELGKRPASVVRRERAVETATRHRGRPSERELRGAQAAATTADEVAALDAIEQEGTWTVGGREVRVTNLDKVLFPGRDGEPPAHEARPAPLPRAGRRRPSSRTSTAAA